MTAKAFLPPVPGALADVALIDGYAAAAAAAMSISSFHDLVRRGMAPRPVIRQPRCTRWRLADVRAWLIQRAELGAADTASHAGVVARATTASAARKRRTGDLAAVA